MAENRLLSDMLAARLLESRTSMTAFSDPIVYGYHSFLGLPIARQAAAYFIARHFLMPEVTSMSTEQALTKINPERVSLGAGAVALLNTLFFLLGDEGDACLIPAPYYAAFENDMSVVACCVPFAVHMANPVLGPTASELDLAFMEARSVSFGRDDCYRCRCLLIILFSFFPLTSPSVLFVLYSAARIEPTLCAYD